MAIYTGDEEAINLEAAMPIEPDEVFDVRPKGVPESSVPVMDDHLNAIIGYRYECTAGVYRLYDLNGKVVGMEEKGIETPLFNPIDLIFLAGGIFRAIGIGVVNGFVRTAPKVAANSALKLAAPMLSVATFGAMRTAFKSLSVQTLKFTATTSARMATKGRYVPIHILHLAIKYGKRAADPQGVKGAFNYTIKMFKNGKPYKLDVVVRESDWTILHFMYK